MVSVKKVYKILGLPFFETERKYEETSSPQKTTTFIDNSSLRIAFYNGGGMGDSIIDVAFIQNLRKILPVDSVVDYYAKSGKVFLKCPFLNHIYTDIKKLDKNKYDLVLGNHRFWMVAKFDEKKIKNQTPVLYNFVKYQLDLRNNILRNNNDNNNLYSQYAMLLGKNRWEQVDLKEITGFNRNNTLYMPLSPEYFSILSRYQLEPKKYITINRGVDSNLGENCPKLWPLEHYKKLVILLKEKYPDLKIIQIGANNKYGLINADLNLLGKTDIEETKILLKNALIHIDVEGGLVHLNHVLHGISCVIFGPTSQIEFAYNENINIQSNACLHTCCWVIQDWQKECLRGITPPPCMTETTPENVLAAVSEFIDEYKRDNYDISKKPDLSLNGSTVYWLGNPYKSLFKKISKSNKVTLLNKSLAQNEQLLLRECGATYEYSDTYNIPYDTNTLPYIFWNPQKTNFHQKETLNELLRVVCKQGKIAIVVKNLSSELRSQFSILDNFKHQIITLIKE